MGAGFGDGFRDDFGDFGGGNFGEGQEQGDEEEQVVQNNNLFKESDVIHLDLSEIFKFYKRQEIWTLYFYKPDNE